MSPNPLVARTALFIVVLAALFSLTGFSVANAQTAPPDTIRIECPKDITALGDNDSIAVRFFISNSQPLQGFSLGFHENSSQFNWKAYDFLSSTSTLSPALAALPGGSANVNSLNISQGQILWGWISFAPQFPWPVSHDAHLFTLYLKRSNAGPAAPECISIDSMFIPPAGFWTITYLGSTSASPAVVRCDDKEVNVLGGCDVVANTPPLALCQPTEVAAGPDCTAAADVNFGSNDPDGDPITLTQVPPGPYPLGVTNVKLIVADDQGAADTCETTVTVLDITQPVVTCPANMTNVPNDLDQCGAVVNFAPTATDNCDADVTIVSNPPSGSFFPAGTTTVTVTATDDAGNQAQCQFDVTVLDNQPPVANCPADIEVTAAPGENTAIVNFISSVQDNCPDATIQCSPASGSVFPLGETTVNCLASDESGNQTNCSFTVTVNAGNSAPVVSDIPDQTINQGETFTDINLDDFVTDPDNTDAELTWTATMFKSKGDLTVSIDPVTHVATIVATPDFTGSAVFTFRATDPGTLFDEDQATFTVNAVVNDPPVVSDIPSQTITDAMTFATFDLDDYVVDPDNADSELDWTFTGNTLLTVSIDADNVVTVTFPDGFTGSETITFTATDPGLLADSDDATFTVNPTLNPDFEVVASPDEITVDAGVAAPFQFDVDVNSIDGFVGDILLSVNGLPSGATADFSFNPVAAPGSSVLSGTTSPETPSGSYDLFISGIMVVGKAMAAHVDTVTLTVGACGAPPVVQVSTDSIDVTAEQGSSPGDEVVYVTNGAVCGTLFWDVNSDQDWVTPDPTSGSVDAGEVPGDPITLSFNTADLDPGEYTAHVQVAPVTVGKVNADEDGVVIIHLTITPKPESNDSAIVSHESGYPGDEVPVSLDFVNFEELAALSVGLTWSSADVNLDSVSFIGSRVDYIDNKIITIDNVLRELSVGILRLPPEPLIPVGSGLWATLWFTIDGAASPQVVDIDTMYIDPGVELVFADVMANSIYPKFSAGSITVLEVVENCISGTVVDGNGAPVEGATVELWDMSGVIETTTSGPDGYYEFCFMSTPQNGYLVRAYAPGYYPGTHDGVSLPDEDVNVVLNEDAGPVLPTNEWVDLYCEQGAYANGELVGAGNVLEAIDPDGVVAGRWVFSTPGTFGFMPVYRDDIWSPSIDEGFEPGQEITLLFNGEPVDLASVDPLIWTGNGDRHEACFTYPSEDQEITQCITLNEGWNLISFNVVLPTNDLETLLADVLDNTDVILSFESVGLTYDPDLPGFSTLFTIDNYHGYWFRMNAADEICVTGLPVDPSTPIDLEFNWNLVSYLPQDPHAVPDALASIFNSVIVVLGYDGEGLTYDPAFPGLATLEEMAAGFGYWIKTDAAGVLTYPDGNPTFARPDATRTLASYVPRISTTNTWINLYGSNVKVDGQAIPAGSVISAYNEAGTQVGEIVVSENGKFGFMPVYGPDSYDNIATVTDGKISFKINGQDVEETVQWTINGARVEVNEFTSIGKGGVLPTQFSLAQNYPNPFNPETSIGYEVAKSGRVQIAIYNIMGAKVKTLVDQDQAAGIYTIKWYGDSDSGQKVASGVYFYKMTAGDFAEVKKMTVLK